MKEIPNSQKRVSFLQKILLLLSLTLMCLFLAALALLAFGNGISAMRWGIVVQNVLVFMIPAFLTAAVIYRQPLAFLDADALPSWRMVGFALLLYFAALPAFNFITWLNEQMTLPAFLSGVEEWMRAHEEANGALTEQLLSLNTVGDMLISVLLVGVLTGMGEETFFRGALQNILFSKPMNRHAAVWISAVVFSAIHVQFFGFVPRMLLGALFGYMMLWSGSLWLAALLHAINNSLVVITLYLSKNGCEAAEHFSDMGSPDFMPWTAAVSAVAAVAIIYYFRIKKQVR